VVARFGHHALVSRDDCSCFYRSERRGADALAYVDRHLRKVRDFDGGYCVEYVCPDFGKGWLLDFVGATPHGGPSDSQARLRTLDQVRRAVQSALRNVEVLLDNPGADAAARRLTELLERALLSRRASSAEMPISPTL
jgi:hypothetical protein